MRSLQFVVSSFVLGNILLFAIVYGDREADLAGMASSIRDLDLKLLNLIQREEGETQTTTNIPAKTTALLPRLQHLEQAISALAASAAGLLGEVALEDEKEYKDIRDSLRKLIQSYRAHGGTLMMSRVTDDPETHFGKWEDDSQEKVEQGRNTEHAGDLLEEVVQEENLGKQSLSSEEEVEGKLLEAIRLSRKKKVKLSDVLRQLQAKSGQRLLRDSQTASIPPAM